MLGSTLLGVLLGGVLTFVVTSVNHRRIHCDDIRKTFLDAVLNTQKCASKYWLDDTHIEKHHSDLIGSITFLHHITPLSYPMMEEAQIKEIKSNLAKLVRELRGKNDTKEEYKKDPERVSKIHTNSAQFMERYYSFYLEQTTMIALINGSAKHAWKIIKKWSKNL